SWRWASVVGRAKNCSLATPLQHSWRNQSARCCSLRVDAPLLFVAFTTTFAISVARQAAEPVVLRKTFGCDAPCISAVASPILQFLHRQREAAAVGIVPGAPVVARERRDVGN